MTESEVVAAVRRELFRLRADMASVGPMDAIYVRDDGDGNATLHGSSRAPVDFWWPGTADEILERLSQLPEDAGPEVVRSEFHKGV